MTQVYFRCSTPKECSATRSGNWTGLKMKIRAHSESDIVDLEDGSRWQVFPGDLDLTLAWKRETDLTAAMLNDEVASHALVGGSANVRVIPTGESWRVREIKDALKQG